MNLTRMWLALLAFAAPSALAQNQPVPTPQSPAAPILSPWFPALPAATPTLATFDARPFDRQLYQRDLPLVGMSQGTADIVISGEVLTTMPVTVVVQSEIDDVPQPPQSLLLNSGGASSSFLFNFTRNAGLHTYDFEVQIVPAGTSTPYPIMEATNVVVGDAFLVTGQSNAAAGPVPTVPESACAGPWVRAYGGARLLSVPGARTWHLASDDNCCAEGHVGTWALCMASQLSIREQIPVAILNGAQGGTRIAQHQRDYIDPVAPGNAYTRMLGRAQRSRLTRARALFWFQGESEGHLVSAAAHRTAFETLYTSWHSDYPALERVFVFQIRDGCQPTRLLSNIQEAQRNFVTLPQGDVVVIPTAGIDRRSDGCHYAQDEYEVIADRALIELEHGLYGAASGLDAPNAAIAVHSPSSQSVVIFFDDPSQALSIDTNIEARFMFESSGPTITAMSATSQPGLLTLGLSSSAVPTSVTYLGNRWHGPWITNSAGVGAYTFTIPVQ